MTRVIHTGDTHLGYRQYHRPERTRDFADAFRQVVDDAVADDVDAVVHAGDLFHDRRPDLADIMTTLSILRELDDAGIPHPGAGRDRAAAGRPAVTRVGGLNVGVLAFTDQYSPYAAGRSATRESSSRSSVVPEASTER